MGQISAEMGQISAEMGQISANAILCWKLGVENMIEIVIFSDIKWDKPSNKGIIPNVEKLFIGC